MKQDLPEERMKSRLQSFLTGTRVLDLSRHLPGPLATLLLADMGAEVTKVESPNGDEMRYIGPTGPNGHSLFFDAINAGKRSIRLNLKIDEGKAALLALVASADVLVESFRPGVMARLGLGADLLRVINPGLIYVAMSGYGQNGLMSQMAGHDGNYLAVNGILSSSGAASGMAYMYPPMADCTASMFAVSSILGALIARGRDGRGCEIDLALTDVMMPFQIFGLAELGLTGHVPRAEAEFLNGGWACYRPYQTKDKRNIALGAIEPHFWGAFCRASERPDWLERQADPLPQSELIAELSAYFAEMSLSECMSRYDHVDCCLSAVLDLQQAVESDYMRTRGLVRRHPDTNIYEAAFPVCVDGRLAEPRPPLVEVPTDGVNWASSAQNG
jgi:alpha-methylacyl-CoA racemase